MLNKLIAAIEEESKKRGYSRTQTAAKLNISENYIYRLKDGSRTPGLDFLISVMAEYPGLKPIVWEYEEYLVMKVKEEQN